MHQYLRAIGFSDKMTRKELDIMLKKMILENDRNDVVKQEDGSTFVEISKKFGPNIGITLCGEVDKDGFHQDYYFPYLEGEAVSTKEGLIIEQSGDGNTYSGACEDPRVGFTLIFYLQNAAALKRIKMQGDFRKKEQDTILTALSLEGKILLPVYQNSMQMAYERESASKRKDLLADARKGNEEAIESLTLEDMDTYSMISKRIQNEDVFSIVETFFMPYGMECDKYQILGRIMECQEIENEYTKEKLYQMTVECNDIVLKICINSKDLFGEPEIGRRFKGIVWLQGRVQF